MMTVFSQKIKLPFPSGPGTVSDHAMLNWNQQHLGSADYCRLERSRTILNLPPVDQRQAQAP